MRCKRRQSPLDRDKFCDVIQIGEAAYNAGKYDSVYLLKNNGKFYFEISVGGGTTHLPEVTWRRSGYAPERTFMVEDSTIVMKI
jgi:hypothetical protein